MFFVIFTNILRFNSIENTLRVFSENPFHYKQYKADHVIHKNLVMFMKESKYLSRNMYR